MQRYSLPAYEKLLIPSLSSLTISGRSSGIAINVAKALDVLRSLPALITLVLEDAILPMSWYTNSYAEDRELLAGSPKCDTVLLRLTNLHVRGNLIPCVELLPNLTLPTLGRLDLALGSLDCSLGRNRTTDIIEIEVSEAIKPLTGLIANVSHGGHFNKLAITTSWRHDYIDRQYEGICA